MTVIDVAKKPASQHHNLQLIRIYVAFSKKLIRMGLKICFNCNSLLWFGEFSDKRVFSHDLLKELKSFYANRRLSPKFGKQEIHHWKLSLYRGHSLCLFHVNDKWILSLE